jgi:hypothetical protein
MHFQLQLWSTFFGGKVRVLLIGQVPGPAGLVGPFVTALAVLLGLGRLHRALWVNHRYWFTTWRWGKVLGAMLLIGAVLKIAMTA